MKIRDQDKISWLRNVAFCAIAIFAAGIIPAKATPVVIGVPSWASAKVTANVVDQLLREELGLAYSVYSYHHNHSDSGAFIIYAGVAAEEAPLVTRTILDEMTRMRHAMVTPDELQSAKDFLKGSMLLSMESTDNRMTRLAKNELFLRDLGTSIEESRDMIDAVTAESVQSLAARLFVNQTLNIQVAGRVDPADFPDSDMLLG